MASPIVAENSVYDIKLSTVVPASITGEDKLHHLTAMDLAMKLHYITAVHFFGGDAAEGLSAQDLKAPMFRWLQLYYPICGRIRRHPGGEGDSRPYVKCNDSGVRIVEAKCAKTVAEWLAVADGSDHHDRLVCHQPLLAHDFGFTPLVFLQLTSFKCGGLCVGMRWAHIIGDAFSASKFINVWGKIMSNQIVPSHLNPPITIPQSSSSSSLSSCRSVKQLDPPLGDNWLTPNKFKMQMHTFHFTETQLSDLISEENMNKHKVKYFEVISAIVWKSLAKTRGTNIVTVCKKSDKFDVENEMLGNTHQAIGVVEVPLADLIRESDCLEIAKRIADNFVDETSAIEKQMEEGSGNIDFLVYGSNLTFVDLEEVDTRGLRINGQGPIFADISIGGVGDEGAVVVVKNGGRRTVNVILAEDQLQYLKNELSMEYGVL